MTELLDTMLAEIGKAIPMIVAALVGAAIAWINALRDRAKVREVVAESAVRQALEQHGDSEEADLAAVAELRKIDKRYRPKDEVAAVKRMVERERGARASQGPVSPYEYAGDDEEDQRDTDRIPPPEQER